MKVGQIGSEMDWVNSHFRDRVDILDGFYALLTGEWCASDDMYQYWQEQFGKGPEWIMEKASMVHFADWKPWNLTPDGRASAQMHSHSFCSCFRNGGMPRPMFAEALAHWMRCFPFKHNRKGFSFVSISA